MLLHRPLRIPSGLSAGLLQIGARVTVPAALGVNLPLAKLESAGRGTVPEAADFEALTNHRRSVKLRSWSERGRRMAHPGCRSLPCEAREPRCPSLPSWSPQRGK